MIYVDPLFKTKKSKKWPYTQACHMVCDGSLDELIKFAEKIGLKKEYLQISLNGVAHFDLTLRKRRRAVERGAKELTRDAIITRKEDWAKKHV